MTDNAIPANNIPDWFLQTVRVMQDTDRALKNADTELRYAMGLEGLDSRLRDEMQYVRDAAGDRALGSPSAQSRACVSTRKRMLSQ
jgi:hypothetical protein